MIAVSPAPQRKMKKHAVSGDDGQHIKVFVRVRPINEKEQKNRSTTLVSCELSRKIVVQERLSHSYGADTSKKFSFDRVFDTKSKQIDIYKTVAKPLVEEVLQGFNCTIFAYGQTGTGKTFTMEGLQDTEGDGPGSWDDSPNAGIIPRCVNHLYDELRIAKIEFSMKVSFLELYNEELFDLLSGQDDTTRLRLYEDSTRKGSCVIQGLEEVLVRSKNDVYNIVDKGSRKRQTACTMLNATSSRSHTVFTITVHMKETTEEGDELLRVGKLHLVDLAGSENIGRSGAVEKRATEAGNINKSLLTLGRVISALVEKKPHVPYRESKLTRLLQDALGGRTKTSIIATVSPSSCNIEETLSTLDYAHRAKNITNKPEINQKVNKKEMIRGYASEIERLRRDMLAMREKSGVYMANENYEDMMKTMGTQEQEITEKIQHLRQSELNLEKQVEVCSELNEKLAAAHGKLEEVTETLQGTQKLLALTATEKDEQTYLVNAHQKVEEKLLGQGRSLVRVAEASTNDVGLLHDKIDRKKVVEKTNEEVTTNFANDYTRFVDKLREEVAHFIVDQQEKGQKGANQTGSARNSSKRACERFCTLLSNAESELKGAYNTVNSIYQLQNTSCERNRATFEKTVDDISSLEENQNDFCSKFDISMTNTKKLLTDQKKSVNELELNQMAKIGEWGKLCSESHEKGSAITGKLEASQNEFYTGHEALVNGVVKYIDEQKAILAKEREEIISIEANIEENQKSILEKVQLSQDLQSALRSKSTQYTDKLEGFVAELPKLQIEVLNRAKESHKVVSTECISINEALLEHKNKTEDFELMLQSDLESRVETIQKRNQTLTSDCDQIKTHAGRFNNLSSEVLLEVRTSIDKDLAESEQMTNVINEKYANTQEDEATLLEELKHLSVEIEKRKLFSSKLPPRSYPGNHIQ